MREWKSLVLISNQGSKDRCIIKSSRSSCHTYQLLFGTWAAAQRIYEEIRWLSSPPGTMQFSGCTTPFFCHPDWSFFTVLCHRWCEWLAWFNFHLPAVISFIFHKLRFFGETIGGGGQELTYMVSHVYFFFCWHVHIRVTSTCHCLCHSSSKINRAPRYKDS